MVELLALGRSHDVGNGDGLPLRPIPEDGVKGRQQSAQLLLLAVLLAPHLDFGLEFEPHGVLLVLSLLLLRLPLPHLLHGLRLLLPHILHPRPHGGLHVGRLAPRVVGVKPDPHLLLLYRSPAASRRGLGGVPGLAPGLHPALVNVVPDAVRVLLLRRVLPLELLGPGLTPYCSRGRPVRRRGAAAEPHEIGRRLLPGGSLPPRRSRRPGRLRRGRRSLRRGRWSGPPLRLLLPLLGLPRPGRSGALGARPPGGAGGGGGAILLLLAHSAQIDQLEGDAGQAGAAVSLAAIHVRRRRGDFVHGLPQGADGARRHLGHVFGHVAAGSARGRRRRPRGHRERARQLRHGRLPHGELGVLVLDVPPAELWPLRAAADLLVHANAPVVPVAARGANALEGDAVPFGEIGKRFRGRTNGVGSGTQGG